MQTTHLWKRRKIRLRGGRKGRKAATLEDKEACQIVKYILLIKQFSTAEKVSLWEFRP